MELIYFIAILIVIGVLWWAINAIFSPYITAPILRIINVIITVAVVIYALMFLLSLIAGFHMPHFR